MAELHPMEGMPPIRNPKLPDHTVRFGSSEKILKLEQENANLKATIAELEELNKRDPLTGLLNKKAYPIVLYDEFAKVKTGEQSSLGVVRMDLDHFSWVNDILGGHHFGDVYLSVTGDLVRKHLRQSADNGFRVGGDEFVILLNNQFDERSFAEAVQRIHESINGKALGKTLQILRRSDRHIALGGGKTEREGTIAFRELLGGLISLRDNVDKATDHFLNHGKGVQAYKTELLAAVTSSDLTRFDAYRNDIRTESELNPAERAERHATEEDLATLLSALFPRLSVSMAGELVTKATDKDPLEIDKKADMMVNTIKRHGGASVSTEVA